MRTEPGRIKKAREILRSGGSRGVKLPQAASTNGGARPRARRDLSYNVN